MQNAQAGSRAWWRWVLVVVPPLTLIILAVLVASTYEGWRLTHPLRQPVVGDPATGASLDYRCLPLPLPAFCSAEMLHTLGDHIPIGAWIVPAYPRQAGAYPGSSGNWSQNTVVLVPDHGQSRTSSPFPVWAVTRALFAAGYNVVLFDPRGEGQSGGSGIGFGTVEVDDLLAVLSYLQNLGPPQGHVAVWGLGTGADTAILAAARSPAVGAVIADSPYLSPEAYLRRAVPSWTRWPAFPFAETILWTMQQETGIHYGAYQPLHAVRSLGGPSPRPLLLVVGAEDTLTPPADVYRLFAASHDSEALSLVVAGAGHLQGFAHSVPSRTAPQYTQYMCDVLKVLSRMQSPAGQSPAGSCQAAPPSS